jgi:hypothetical protein
MSEKTVLGLVPKVMLGWEQIPTEKIKHVYFLQCAETARVKIGVADDVDKRIAKIQAMSATELHYCGSIPSNGYELETHLHQKFAEYRTHGEWFHGEHVADFINDMVKRYAAELEKLKVATAAQPEPTNQGESL